MELILKKFEELGDLPKYRHITKNDLKGLFLFKQRDNKDIECNFKEWFEEFRLFNKESFVEFLNLFYSEKENIDGFMYDLLISKTISVEEFKEEMNKNSCIFVINSVITEDGNIWIEYLPS